MRISVPLALVLGGLLGIGGPGPTLASPQAVTLSGNQFLLDGQPFVPHGFNSIALLNSPWCTTKITAAAAQNFTSAELTTAQDSWHANTLRFQVSQPVLAGPDGAAYAQQIQTGVSMARNAGFVVIVAMQDESQACGPAEPLPSQETETAWATLIDNTGLSSDPGVMFELFNEPQNSTATTPATDPQEETWVDWLNGGRQIEPTSAQTWAAYTPVGHQALVDYLRDTLSVTNVLIADGASYAETLQGMPVLSDPGSSYQIAYAVHPYNDTGGPSEWSERWGYLTSSYAVIATEWNYRSSECGTAKQTIAPQFLSYMRNTVNVGVLGWVLDVFKGALMADTNLDPTQCGTASPGGGYDFLNSYMDTFSGSGGVSPSAPPDVTSTGQTTGSITLTWSASTDPGYPAADITYDVYRGGTLAGTTAAGVTSFTDTGLSPGTSYTYTVTAADPAGNVSGPSQALTQATQDCPAPAAPAGLTGTADSASSVSLSWSAVPPSGNCTIAQYVITRDGSPLADTTGTAYTDQTAAASTTYDYAVFAVTVDGVPGASSPVSVTTPAPADPGPTAPGDLSATAVSGTQIDLAWTASADPVTGIADYEVYRGGELVGTAAATSSPSYDDPGLTPDTSYTYQVVAVSGGGLTASATVTAATLDTLPPSAPPDVTSSAQTTGSITLTWSASTDPGYPAADLTYEVYRDGGLAGTTAAGVTSFTDTGLSPGTSYTYTVTAADPAGNVSGPSQALSQATQDCPAPAAPAGLTGTAKSAVKVLLGWKAVVPSGAGCHITNYLVKRNGLTIASPVATAYTDTSVAADTKYTYQVLAVVTGGIKGAWSAAATLTTPKVRDKSPPSPASGLKATATGDSQVSLSWSPGSDPQSGVKEYEVLRNGKRIATVASTTLSFTDSGLAGSTSYSYTVATVDGAGLTSDSGSVVVTTG